MGDCQSRPSKVQEQQHTLNNSSSNNHKFYPFWNCSYINENENSQCQEKLEIDKRYIEQLMKQCNIKIEKSYNKKPRIKLEILRSQSQYINKSCFNSCSLYIVVRYGGKDFKTLPVKQILPVWNQILKIPFDSQYKQPTISLQMYSHPDNILISEDRIEIQNLESENVVEKMAENMKLVYRAQLIKNHNTMWDNRLNYYLNCFVKIERMLKNLSQNERAESEVLLDFTDFDQENNQKQETELEEQMQIGKGNLGKQYKENKDSEYLKENKVANQRQMKEVQNRADEQILDYKGQQQVKESYNKNSQQYFQQENAQNYKNQIYNSKSETQASEVQFSESTQQKYQVSQDKKHNQEQNKIYLQEANQSPRHMNRESIDLSNADLHSVASVDIPEEQAYFPDQYTIVQSNNSKQ